MKNDNRYESSMHAVHYSTSAKVNRGLNELFIDLSSRMLEAYKGKHPDFNENNVAASTGAGAPRSTIRGQDLLNDFEESMNQNAKPESGGCC